jgi:hypothetical protein
MSRALPILMIVVYMTGLLTQTAAYTFITNTPTTD